MRQRCGYAVRDGRSSETVEKGFSGAVGEWGAEAVGLLSREEECTTIHTVPQFKICWILLYTLGGDFFTSVFFH